MWIITPPSSTIRRASAAYSCGVYGIAGHWSRLASDPEIEQVMTTGSSRLKARPLSQEVGSATSHLSERGARRQVRGRAATRLVLRRDDRRAAEDVVERVGDRRAE